MYNKDSVKLKKWLEWPFVITDQIARRKEDEEMIYLLGWSNFLQETWSKIRQYCRLLLHLSHFFVQIDFQTLFLFLHSRVFTYTPLEDGSPYCPVALGFLHLARRGAFLKDPIEAWESRDFSMREGVGDWRLFCQTDTWTQTLKGRSNLPLHLVGRKQCHGNLSYITTLPLIFKHCL